MWQSLNHWPLSNLFFCSTLRWSSLIHQLDVGGTEVELGNDNCALVDVGKEWEGRTVVGDGITVEFLFVHDLPEWQIDEHSCPTLHEHRFPPQLPLQRQVVTGGGGGEEERGRGEIDSVELKDLDDIGASEPKTDFKSISQFMHDLPEWHLDEQNFPAFLHEHCFPPHPFLQLHVDP